MSSQSRVFGGGPVVLADRVLHDGWVAVSDGRVVEIGEGQPPERVIDLGGDTLMPGLVELHTDHLEAHVTPRPKVQWDPTSAVVAYDGQLAVSGITTVLDSLRVWTEDGADGIAPPPVRLAEAIQGASARGLLRADHFLHLRCEVPTAGVVDLCAALIGRPDVRLVSLMDHTPGQRQFRDEEKLRTYYRGKSGGLTDAELDVLFAKRLELHARYGVTHRRKLVELAQAHGVPLASHDDTTLEHVEESAQDRVAIAEFPTTIEAAEELHGRGISVMMGAPNLVRGGSHSGNVSAQALAEAGLLDIFSSDYVPASLLLAAIDLSRRVPAYTLADAVRTVTKAPAEAVGLHDRGEIAAGRRADLIRVDLSTSVPVVRAVWREGQRVA
jgi:alpha-D-ribose 1-methylphosphonate 5-triphosphate diphosphatase